MRLSNKFWTVSFYSFNRLKNKLKNYYCPVNFLEGDEK